MTPSKEPKIYLLPNLMTAGNLFCGFAAISRLIEAAMVTDNGISPIALYYEAIGFILGACVFDLLDGRLARLGGHESKFGGEFDSLADIVSFGVAPALMVYQMVLRDFHKTGWLIAFIYLVCGALRLARFNCYNNALSDQPSAKPKENDEFVGFPIPAAAGVVASLTLFMLWMKEGERTIGPWKFALPALLLFLSFMMFSKVRYPSFKGLGWRSQRSMPKFLLIIVTLVFAAMYYELMPAVLFVLYLLYGFVRPFISRAWRHEIEDDEAEEEEPVLGDQGPQA